MIEQIRYRVGARSFTDWRCLWLLLLLPVALFLPAMPIDETRYLAVAWEMRFAAIFCVLHLNGATYSDKGPLLFWLINLAWLLAGIACLDRAPGRARASLGSLMLFERLVRMRLSRIASWRAHATLMLAGMIFFALFSSAIMFDVLLTTCVLIALHGVLDLDARRWRRGMAWCWPPGSDSAC